MDWHLSSCYSIICLSNLISPVLFICDFGPEFSVLDVDGEDARTGIIASISITTDNRTMVSCVDDERLDFQDGDLVVFSEVQGMTELNDGKPRTVMCAGPFSFCIEDTSNFGTYTKGGIVTQVKERKILKFKSLRDSIREPGNFPLSDCSKFKLKDEEELKEMMDELCNWASYRGQTLTRKGKMSSAIL